MKRVIIGDILEFDYINWKGEKGLRTAEYLRLYYGSNEYHTEPQWILHAYDMKKHEYREFAMKDMSNVKVVEN